MERGLDGQIRYFFCKSCRRQTCLHSALDPHRWEGFSDLIRWARFFFARNASGGSTFVHPETRSAQQFASFRETKGTIDQRHMGKSLGEITELSFRPWIVLFGKKSDVVSQSE